MKKKVVVGLSGGVDSACTAYLLQEAGYEVVGCSIWMNEYNNFDDAEKIAHSLGIQYQIIDRRELFQKEVKDYFIKTYKLGMTPNPCVKCNKYVKFKTLFDVMLDFDADFVATGHYARVNNSKLMVAFDKAKDQSYFLYGIPKSYFEKILFPLGGYLKSNVKELSKNFSDFLAKKEESQDICFLKGDYKKCFDSCTGDIINDKGEILGKHNGLAFYTIGQRKGLGIGGINGLPTHGWFVCKKDVKNNILYVASGSEDEHLFSDKCTVTNINLFNEKLNDGTHINVKFRYRQQDQGVTLYNNDDSSVTLIFDKPYKAVTPGQACVFYDGDVCLGGGLIDKVYRNDKLLN